MNKDNLIPLQAAPAQLREILTIAYHRTREDASLESTLHEILTELVERNFTDWLRGHSRTLPAEPDKGSGKPTAPGNLPLVDIRDKAVSCRVEIAIFNSDTFEMVFSQPEAFPRVRNPAGINVFAGFWNTNGKLPSLGEAALFGWLSDKNLRELSAPAIPADKLRAMQELLSYLK